MVCTCCFARSTQKTYSHRSFLQYVPARYESSDCISTAADCLLAQVHARFSPTYASTVEALKLYGKAIRTLQRSIDDETLCFSSDVLCASQLLILREVLHSYHPITFPQLLTLLKLLNPHTDTSWPFLLYGSRSIVQHRTSKRFTSDFDRALFIAHIGPLVFESLISHNHCYLAEPEWLGLYQSLSLRTPHLDDRSPLAIQIRSLMFKYTN